MLYIIDMDGVLVDFAAGVCALFGSPLPGSGDAGKRVHEYLGIPSRVMWDRIDEAGERFWHELRPTPFASDLVALLRARGEIFIASSPSLSPGCAAGKIGWLQSRFGRHFRGYAITPAKHLLSAPGRVLIDDSAENVDAFRAGGGEGILVPTVENGTLEPGTDVADYLRIELDRVEGEDG